MKLTSEQLQVHCEVLDRQIKDLASENKAMKAQLDEVEAKLAQLRKMAIQTQGAAMRTGCSALAMVNFIDGKLKEVGR